MKEPITGSDSYTCLQLVPREFYNIIFIAFHANQVGTHLNLVRTLHQIRLRFYWPSMFSYVKQMCNTQFGCALSNPTCGKSSELVYGFPIKAPFLVMHFDAYSYIAGKHSGFKGSKVYLISCCSMCSFAYMEPVTSPSATTFTSAIMKILLWYGFCHTAVLNKDPLRKQNLNWLFYIFIAKYVLLLAKIKSIRVKIIFTKKKKKSSSFIFINYISKNICYQKK